MYIFWFCILNDASLRWISLPNSLYKALHCKEYSIFLFVYSIIFLLAVNKRSKWKPVKTEAEGFEES